MIDDGDNAAVGATFPSAAANEEGDEVGQGKEDTNLILIKARTVTERLAMERLSPMMVMTLRAVWCSSGSSD